MRKLLYEAANSILSLTRETFALMTWAMKIAKRRGLKKACVALARRLAVIIHSLARTIGGAHHVSGFDLAVHLAKRANAVDAGAGIQHTGFCCP